MKVVRSSTVEESLPAGSESGHAGTCRACMPPRSEQHGSEACQSGEEQVHRSGTAFRHHLKELLPWAGAWSAAFWRQYDKISELTGRQIQRNLGQPAIHAGKLSRSQTVEGAFVKQRPDGVRKVPHLRVVARVAAQGEHLEGQPSRCFIGLCLVPPQRASQS